MHLIHALRNIYHEILRSLILKRKIKNLFVGKKSDVIKYHKILIVRSLGFWERQGRIYTPRVRMKPEKSERISVGLN